jgi:1-acyl-sn-glycerol-3-phosphate acyltransferase
MADARVDDRSLRSTLAVIRVLQRYHRHRVVGLDHIPETGPALLVINHSLATYDGMLMSVAVFDHRGRLPIGLGDRLLFRIPGLRRWVQRIGVVVATPENGQQLLEEGHLVVVAPGGMREALRPTRERYETRWDKRRGFVRLAIRAAVPIILVACPAADDIYRVYRSPLARIGYKRWKVPLPVARGLGPTLLPRPVQLTHYIDRPIAPPKMDVRSLTAQVDSLHEQVQARMRALMTGAA